MPCMPFSGKVILNEDVATCLVKNLLYSVIGTCPGKCAFPAVRYPHAARYTPLISKEELEIHDNA